jgi:hypothetical protein
LRASRKAIQEESGVPCTTRVFVREATELICYSSDVHRELDYSRLETLLQRALRRSDALFDSAMSTADDEDVESRLVERLMAVGVEAPDDGAADTDSDMWAAGGEPPPPITRVQFVVFVCWKKSGWLSRKGV